MKDMKQPDAGIEVPNVNSRTNEAPLAPAHGPAELRLSGETGRIVIINAQAMLRRRYNKTPLWCLVSDLTGHGSGYSIQICRSANLDPMQNCGAKQLLDLPPNVES